MNCKQMVIGVFAVMLFSNICSPLRADMIIDVPDVTITPGGSTTIDIWISSNTSAELDLYDYEFQITPVGSPVGNVTFSSTQNFDETTSGYVFERVPTPLANFSLVPNGNLIGGADETPDRNVVFPRSEYVGAPLSMTAQLLARFDLQHNNPTAVGESFEISLVTSNSTFGTGADNAFPFGGDLQFTALSIDPTSDLTGLITVGSASGPTAIPEPATMTLVLGSFAIATLGTRRRRDGAIRSPS